MCNCAYLFYDNSICPVTKTNKEFNRTNETFYDNSICPVTKTPNKIEALGLR